MRFTTADRQPKKVRTRLLLAVNVPLGFFLALLLVWDYHREMSHAAETKHANLTNEAVAIHRAVAHLLNENDQQGAQAYINSVCHQMRSEGATHHTIVVKANERLFSSHHENGHSESHLSAITSTTTSQLELDGEVLIVGRFSQPELTVTVTESLTTARRVVRRMIVGRVTALAGLGLIAIILVNTAVLHTVGRPIRALVRAVDSIRIGNYVEVEGPFTTREFSRLAAAVSLMSRTLQANEHQRKIQMEKAREIQQHLLPGKVTVPGLDVATWFSPAERVSGDYYDVLPLPDGSWVIALADVSGHGIPSALEAAMLKVLLGEATQQTQDPAEMLSLINTHFTGTVPDGDFATVFLLHWRPGTCQAEYASAGHLPGLLRDARGNVIKFDSTGMLVGVDQQTRWQTKTIPLSGNDHLIIVSDGVTECRSQHEEMFGIDRLAALLGEVHPATPEAIIQQLKHRLGAFAGSEAMADDVTALAIQFVTSLSQQKSQTDSQT